MRNVLFLTNDINLQKGGQELANKYLVGVLSKKFNLSIINLKFYPIATHYGKVRLDFEVDFVNLGFLSGFKQLISLLREVLKKNSFDLVVISANPFSTLLLFFILKSHFLFKKLKVVHWCHIDPLSSIFRASRIPFILYPLGLFLYRKFDLIVITNPFMGKVFNNYYFVPKRKMKLITYPLRPDFDKKIKEKIKFNFSRPVVVTATRLTQTQKDPATLIKAFKIVNKKFPSASLLLLGDGPDKEKLRMLAKELGIYNSVHFLGFVDNPLGYFRRSDVFVLSSRSEGTPIVLVEAQACGVPIVATDCPVGPRWVLDSGKAGILTKVGSSDELANAIINLLSKKEPASKMVNRGLLLSKRFAFRKFELDWVRTLNKLIS